MEFLGECDDNELPIRNGDQRQGSYRMSPRYTRRYNGFVPQNSSMRAFALNVCLGGDMLQGRFGGISLKITAVEVVLRRLRNNARARGTMLLQVSCPELGKRKAILKCLLI